MDKPESHRLDYTPLAGRTTGIEIGKREMIMKMCDKGYTIAQIADVAGMDEKQIEDTIKMLNCYQYKRLNMI